MAKSDGGPAFPYSALEPDPKRQQLVGSIYADNVGMSLRDYFAGQAVAGLLAAVGGNGPTLHGEIAREAYAFADAMLAEREKD